MLTRRAPLRHRYNLCWSPSATVFHTIVQSMPVEHYENFPVASILLPRHLRAPVEAIYAFARSADDLADEGDATPEARLAALDAYRQQLDLIDQGTRPQNPMFARLADTIASWRLPLQPFYDLLSAFSQDVQVKRYADRSALLDYCRRSANPVGCLMLHLYQRADTARLQQSDAICSALQIINFLQDIGIDLDKQRVYLPQDEMAAFGVDDAALQALQIRAPGAALPPAFLALMQDQCAKARALMLSGAPLARSLPGRIGWELRLVVQGGLLILDKIAANGYDVFQRRPQLRAPDWLRLLWRAWRM